MLVTTAGSANEQSITFGIVPQQSATKLASLWGPITAYLSEATGFNVRFATAPDIPTFEERLASGMYDIAYMNPYHYTIYDSYGYQAIAKARDKRIKGIIVVHKDSDITDVAQLDGKQLAFPSSTAFAASMLTRSYLKQIGVNFTSLYVSSHDSVYQTVARGIFPAGGGIMRTLNSLDQETRDQLRILWTSEGFTPHAIAVHSRINAGTVTQLQNALLDMSEDERGTSLLNAINLNGFEAAVDSDWDDVRALHIEALDENGDSQP